MKVQNIFFMYLNDKNYTPSLPPLQIPPAEFPSPYADRLRSIESDRRRVQSEHHSAYERALVDLREELRERDGQEIEEEMKEQIRKWFFEDRSEGRGREGGTDCRNDDGNCI